MIIGSRYLYITRGLTYSTLVTQRRIHLVIFVTWLIPSVLACIAYFLFDVSRITL